MLQKAPDVFSDPHAAAAHAGLHYRSDDTPGITRRKRGAGFEYLRPDGSTVRDEATRDRIRALAIPPAWEQVWISPDPKGHLAATGIDARGRKQYRYNPEFVATRDAAKFEHILAFAEVLPRLRRRVRRDLKQKGLPREKVLATIVFLLERTLSRVGNEAYARENKSFGLTTLRNRHARIRGEELRFAFSGKSGKTWSLGIKDRRVAKVVRACQELPGQHLFEYRDKAGTVHTIGSADVNAYLHQAAGSDITAKDFRTWFGTVEASMALERFRQQGKAPIKRHIRAAIGQAAERLGNTVAVCRKCYVHPAALEAYEAKEFALPELGKRKRIAGLTVAEQRVLLFLRQRLRRRAKAR